MNLIEALNGGNGALDAWLETQSEVEVRAAIKALISPEETLRDKFAAKALAALINHPNKDGENRGAKAVPILAKFAYEYADAMLEARNA
ncbi:hypothetical protein ACFSKY_22500 [Azotobacter chroococcum]|uniref:Uncharacterized protein n=1 Tax=Azotobacter chroococcum TaxID=353 RepID=A0A4R1PJA1_9GAMM|nr:hypothetical protein [Azotobacter chroococcum]TBV95930.1 hypothetical protein E0E53_12015 [Azotobacter chroococcum]TCL26854.1 hypothetical protein EV691_12960 [Azotobacter chroococcum]